MMVNFLFPPEDSLRVAVEVLENTIQMLTQNKFWMETN